ncbi:M3 family metallopeptidase [Salinisphaera sp.]|uniref:M3 family metallopeptidase n=1 Tax=Salinisphaera sp. TaxID=1914330 RepID=UPI000C5A070C|nr:M3 family metallopeptidase [Salinisphaera sp.]MAS08635.1 oligopeptidase A [Salinisphaera sp.]|tara:strand:- start:49413 stop:51488 length:2076 start_codon:yes stop_codon:yes gene_type:complete
MSDAPNPLLELVATDGPALPDFAALAPHHAEPAVDHLIAAAREAITTALAHAGDPSWDTVIAPIEDSQDALDRAFSPVAHMHAVMDSPEWRAAYQACVPKLTAFSSEVGQNTALFETVARLKDSPAYVELGPARQRVIDHMLRDFELAGVALEPAAKTRFAEIAQRRSELSTTFQQNLLDATQAWQKHITDETRLAGLPTSAKELLAQNAAQKDLDGWLITLDAPSLMAVLTYADDRSLRAELHEAFATRASDVGPNGGEYDNSALMDELLALRHEAAGLLGFANYAEQSLAKKMADSPKQIETFLLDLAARSETPAHAELDALAELARADGIDTLAAWDIGYYAEKLKTARYDYAEEDLKPYFAAPAVIDGLFKVCARLFDIHVSPRADVATWHDNVTVYDIHDTDGTLRGVFYLDPYAREGKRGGAWMHPFQSRRVSGAGTQTPLAFLTCNFSPPVGDKPALLTHGEVTTLFHEFGHGLHHMLTRVDEPSLAGIAGVEWDAVELPSQFMENWCWHRESLDLFAAHYQSGEALPQALFDKLYAARNHMAGWQMLRQVEISLFDLRLHKDHDAAAGARVMDTLARVRAEVAPIEQPAYNRFPHSFMHIFAGGYAAGYYSYKWAEVLSADAFAAFEETALFDAATGARFKTEVLERGATRNAVDNFVAFRGREPAIEALLRHSGLADDQQAA